jgi:hypothetical protein
MPGQQFILLTATAAVAHTAAGDVTVWLVEEALTPDKKADVVVETE